MNAVPTPSYADPRALAASVAELDALGRSDDRGLTPSEGESIALVLLELGNREGYKSMFEDAVRSLAAIDELLGIPADDAGGAAPILAAIRELQARARPPRTELRVLEDNERLAHDLARADGWTMEKGARFQDSRNPRAAHYWNMASIAQEVLLNTDVANAEATDELAEKLEDSFAQLLDGVDIALNGPNDPNEKRSFYGLDKRAAEVMAELTLRRQALPATMIWRHLEETHVMRLLADDTGAVSGVIVRLDPTHERFDGGPVFRQAWYDITRDQFVCSATAAVLRGVTGWAMGSGDLTAESPVQVDRAARELAESLWRKHYREDSPSFELAEDTLGVLSQLDNMTTGLSRHAYESLDDMALQRTRFDWHLDIQNTRGGGERGPSELERDAFQNGFLAARRLLIARGTPPAVAKGAKAIAAALPALETAIDILDGLGGYKATRDALKALVAAAAIPVPAPADPNAPKLAPHPRTPDHQWTPEERAQLEAQPRRPLVLNMIPASELELVPPAEPAPPAAYEPLAVTDLPAFPAVLRKMWSGGEVQTWINDNIKPLVQERHHLFHCSSDHYVLGATPPERMYWLGLQGHELPGVRELLAKGDGAAALELLGRLMKSLDADLAAVAGDL